MGWRQTGKMHKPEPISVQTCDVCGSDIGLPDGYRHKSHYDVRFDSQQDYGEPEPATALCSAKCLLAFAQAEFGKVNPSA